MLTILGEYTTDVPVIIADANDEKTLNQMASKARVIINCVGPFNFYGEEVVKACINQKAHLVDIAGEITVWYQIAKTFHTYSDTYYNVLIYNYCISVSENYAS